MEIVDTVIVGAGVVGLAVARALSADRSVIILEQEDRIGTHLSSRNSEVVHAGLYYPPGSLKSQLCLAGNEALYRYCEETGVPFRQCGKLLVAQDGQQQQLDALLTNATASGAKGLQRLARHQWQHQEPWLHASEVLLSARTGIVDSHALLYQLRNDAERNGALVMLRHRLLLLECESARFTLELADSEGKALTLRSQQLIMAAGLSSIALLEKAQGFPAAVLPEQRQAKGNYFSLTGKSPTQRLVYPLPEQHGLGIHLTVDLAGQARFGPDVEWIPSSLPPDYQINAGRKADFLQDIRHYWPAINPDRLQPAYAGIRPKLFQDGVALNDFLIQDQTSHGIAGLINLLGIESPGLTAALAIATRVAQQ